MGWFDGDSSGEEEQRDSLHKQNTGKQDEDEEEEDPLDAYMKALGDPTASTTTGTTTTTSQPPKPGRLDLDNEDEATSHWQTKKSTTSSAASELENNEVDEDGFIKQSAVAKRALEQTFHKAGHTQKLNNDDDDDENDTMKRKKSKQVDIQLDQVDHNQMRYEEFDKVFWNPSSSQTTTTATDTNTDHHSLWRQQHGITLHTHYNNHKHHHKPSASTNMMAPIYDFLELRDVMEDALLQHITKSGYHHPTPVQAQTLPVVLSGHDALITAPTGSGKTLAYVWPMVVHVCAQHHLAPHETGPIGLILVPTRELAQQVQKHVQTMLQPMEGSSLTIIGGMGKYPLTQHLRQKGGVEIVVATPGRLLDVLATQQQQQAASASSNKKLQGLSLERTTMVVLDESDRLLHMGFANQVTQILQNIRPDRQTLMLSATMSHRIEKVAQQWLGSGGGGSKNNDNNNKPGIGHSYNNDDNNNAASYIRIAVGRTGQASLHVQQHVMVVPSDAAKLSWLNQMLPVLCGIGRTLVFCATKDGCEQLANQLQQQLLPQDSTIAFVTLHGDKHQTDRNAALRKFIKQKQQNQKVVLIATDVASRGLDIPQVTTVINYDPPKNLDVHVHRVGRAGRLSSSKNKKTGEDGDDSQQPNEGTAYTLLRTPKDADIGHVLLGAMEREDRPVSDDLRQLAKLSRQHRGGNGSSYSHTQSRSRWNKAGLGTSSTHHGNAGYFPRTTQPPSNDHYGPSSSSSSHHPSQQPSPKKSRWS